MKKFSLTLLSFLAIAAGVASCSGGDNADKGKAPEAKKTETKNADASQLPNYRYVDLDTILANYNLSKDYNESMIQMQNNLESSLNSKQQNLQSMAQQYQQKYQNNGYKTQEEFERDQRNLASAQNSAQQEAAQMQGNYEKQAMQMQKTIQDSIESYIKIYNAQKGYDAIFMKAATLYINPALDVTDEVVKGLNERYNKVKK